MQNNEILTLEEQFAKECKLINLKYEYIGYEGEEKWAIVSELSKDDLIEKYPEIVNHYIPFVMLSVEQGEVIREYNRNEDKYRKRRIKKEQSLGYDEMTEQCHPELVRPNYWEEKEYEEFCMKRQEEKLRLLFMAMESLTDKQRKYLKLYFVKGMTTRDIAKEEGISHQAIEKHIRAATRKFEKIFANFFRK